MDTLAEGERGAGDLRLLKRAGKDALPRLCAAGAKMQARQFPAAASESHLSLLLRASRQVRLSQGPSCHGKALRQSLRPPMGGCDNDAHPPLWRSLLSLARFRRPAKPGSPGENHPGLWELAAYQVLVADQGIPNGGGLPSTGRPHSLESLHSSLCSSDRRQAAAWLQTAGEHGFFRKGQHPSRRPYLPGTKPGESMRLMPCLLGPISQGCDLSLEVENSGTGPRCAMRARARTGRLIIGTLERLSGRADLVEVSFTRKEDGKLTYEYEGYTEVFWEEQRTARSNGRPIFLDEEGFQWEETQLLLSEE